MSAGDSRPQRLTAEEDYRKAGFSRRLGAGQRAAVLVIDAVQAYTDPASPLYAGVEDSVAAMAQVVEIARVRSLPVIFTRVSYSTNGHDGGVFRRKVAALDLLVEGNPYGQIVPELTPADGDVVIEKAYASAFFGTPLAAHLTSRAIDTVIVTGLTTSGCVRATAVDACQHGFVPLVVAEACGDRLPEPHRANLFDLDAKYADVVRLADLPDILDRPAS